MADKSRRIPISFKNTQKDIELYNTLMNMEDRSYEIKKILRSALIDDKKKEKHKESINNNSNILEF